MSVLDQLACSLGHRDEVPNQELARCLAESEDSANIREVADGLQHKERAVQADCIKVLYEIGYLKPALIAPYASAFLKLLKSRNNRLVWGGMIALSTVGGLAANELFPHWAELRQAMDGGSVITCDAGVLALARIAAAQGAYSREIFPYLLQHLKTCRPKDVPQHAEKTLVAVNAENKAAFIAVLEKRLDNAIPSQAARITQTIKKAQKRI